MTRPKAAILLASERSGTHLLRSIVNANGAGYALDEVANAASARPENTIEFFGFRRLYHRSFPDRVVPDVENSLHLLGCYLDNVALQVAPGAPHPIILDIKYGHIANFAAGWWNPLEPPALFHLAAERGLPVIHLVRRRVAETAISGLYATASGVWKARTTGERSSLRLPIPRAQLIAEAVRIRAFVALARRWIAGVTVAEMRYEELLDVASPSWQAFSAACEAPVTRIETPWVKAIPRHEDAIENHAEIADLLTRDIDDPFWDQPR